MIKGSGEAGQPVLGALGGIAVDGDRIYAVDPLARIVQVYDLSGAHVGVLGGPGEGPGEFLYPKGIGISADGRLFVQDNTAREIHVFGPDREYIESWQRPLVTKIWDDRFLVTPDGAAFVWELQNPFSEGDEHEWAMRLFDSTGRLGVVIETPPFGGDEAHYVRWGGGFNAGGAEVPFAPIQQWAMSAAGDLVVAEADRYRLEVRRAGGETLVIERVVAPVSVRPGEYEWLVRDIELEAGGDWQWPDRPVARHKPFVKRVFWGAGGTLWVYRELEAAAVEDCARGSTDSLERVRRPCWRRRFVFDVFDSTGRLATTIPYEGALHPFVRPILEPHRALIAETDAMGNPAIVNYRIAPTLPVADAAASVEPEPTLQQP